MIVQQHGASSLGQLTTPQNGDIIEQQCDGCAVQGDYVLVRVDDYRRMRAALIAFYQVGASVLELPPLMTGKQRRRMGE